MPIAIMIEAEGMTADEYDAIVEEVQDFAHGRLYHVAGPTPEGNWRVVDVWESQEAFDRFAGERLMPIARRNNFKLQSPLIWDVYHILVGDEV